MGAGEIIALASLIVTVILVVGGALLRSRDNQIAELRREREAQQRAYETKLDFADRTIDTMRETNAELRRQLDRQTITAEITERFLGGLPRQVPPTTGSGDR